MIGTRRLIGERMSTLQEILADERYLLDLKRSDADLPVQPVGKQALLYCGACQAVIPYSKVAAGLMPDWPYCPVHQGKPLMVRDVSFAAHERGNPRAA